MGSYKKLFKKMASIDQIIGSINDSCRKRGGKYKNYSCKTVSWDDVQRGTVGGGLSCWGSNITDTYLKSKDGRRLFTVRSDNWNEKLGHVSTNQIALVQGNQSSEKELSPITLKTFLENAKKYGNYAGLDVESLANLDLDQKVSVRFQTTFLPVDDSEKANIEFATEAYNYNTRDDADPRNLILLCTSQGIALQQDGAGTKRIYHHDVKDGKIERYWLEAEKSKHKVGGAQVETKEEKEDAIKRGKATSSVIGVKALGTRFNVLMTLQIPLQQQVKKPTRSNQYSSFAPKSKGFSFGVSHSSDASCASEEEMGGALYDNMECLNVALSCPPPCSPMKSLQMDSAPMFRKTRAKRGGPPPPPPSGTANAARVSRGSKFDDWDGLTMKKPIRNPQEHITATIVIYFTVSGGVPKESDVVAAIDDMEMLYASCNDYGNLADKEFDFMKSELTVKDVVDIKGKLKEQPPNPTHKGVTNFDQFPQ